MPLKPNFLAKVIGESKYSFKFCIFKSSKNIEAFRFDEAAKNVYQFVWHSYCDWYLEFLKPIFNSKNSLEIKEARLFSSFMMANILKMLHPFIPFFTESLWAKNNYKKVLKANLISAEWPQYKKNSRFR